MTSITVQLKTIKSQLERLYVPKHILTKLQIKSNVVIPIFFGIGNSRNVRVLAVDTSRQEIYLTNKLAQTLRFPYLKSILIKKEAEGLRIGPLIGILTTDYTGKKFSNKKHFVDYHFSQFFKGLLTPEPLYSAFYFVFTPDNVNWQNKTVTGYFYRPNSIDKSWELKTVSLPDVIYNRIPNRTIERQSSMDIFKQEYLRLGGKLFNPNFFNKWEMYGILSSDPKTKDFIPITHLNPTSEVFKEMVEKHPIVYLKPANGSLGLGIYKIIKQHNKFLVQYRHNSHNKSILFKNIYSLYNYIFSKRFRNRYLIQQGIDLIEYEGNPVDFRIQLHKNNLDRWQIVAIGAKAAGKGSVTTHLRTGGKVIDTNHFIDKIFNDDAEKIIKKIKATSIEIAKKIEKELNSSIGELGLDIGIDKQHYIWLFEVNSKPGRSIFKHPSLQNARLESSKLLLEYGIFLAGYDLNEKTN